MGLAAMHEITVERSADDCCANAHGRRICIPPDVTSDDDYLSALHEIGHVVMGDLWYETQGEREFVAWVFALLHARGVDPTAARFVWRCMTSYLQNGGRVYQMPAPSFAHHE